MKSYLLRRIAAAIFAVWFATIMVFVGVQAIPGSPVQTFAGEIPNLAREQFVIEKYGLDDPVVVQYVNWLGLTVTGDLGDSFSGQPVSELIRERLPVTFELAFLAVLIAAVIGIPAGVIAATHRGKFLDWIANGVSLAGLSIPNFWLGLMVILVFAVNLQWLPASGYVPFLEDPFENLKRMLMPSIVLGAAFASIIMRQTRSSMIEALNSDYIKTAWAKGLSPRAVIWRHALRNSLTTVITILGLQLGRLISGAVVIESIFLLPGFGQLLLDSILSRDYTLVQGAILVAASGYVIVNLLTDLAYSIANPKVRLTAGSG